MNNFLTPSLGIAKSTIRRDLDNFDLLPMANANKWSFPSQPYLNVGNPTRMTIRLRFCMRSVLTNNGICTRGALGSTQGDWAIGFLNGSSMALSFRVNNNGTTLQSVTVLSVDTMYYVECSYDQSLSSNQLKMFIDGALNCQGTYTTAITNNANPIYLGTYFSVTGNAFQQGSIYEFEFCANCIRNTVAYTKPLLITPDAQTTVYYRGGFYTPR